MPTEQPYIVLRSKGAPVPTLDNLGGLAGLGFAQPVEEVEVEEVELSSADRSDLRRDPRTLAIAPPMPLRLIEPMEQEDVDEADAEITWGVHAVAADASNFDGSGVTVAVLDTGIDPNHPAFAGVNLVRQNFTTESDDDLHGHGTHCAGTIFGKDVNGARIGVARNVKKAVIGKVLGQGGSTTATLMKAIQWAVNEGANVISMSLGIDFPGQVDRLVNQFGYNVNPATSIALEGYRANVNLFTEIARVVQAQGAFGQGCIIVAASGNESNRPEYEISVAPPAAGTGIIAVGALGEVDNGLDVAYFSNNQVDVSGPGVRVLSAIPGGGLGNKSGTSMATPHVAGVAALWAQRQLDNMGLVKNSALVAQLIASGTTASIVSGPTAEDYGTGLVQAPLN